MQASNLVVCFVFAVVVCFAEGGPVSPASSSSDKKSSADAISDVNTYALRYSGQYAPASENIEELLRNYVSAIRDQTKLENMKNARAQEIYAAIAPQDHENANNGAISYSEAEGAAPEKRAQPFVRFGKRAQTFVRFGKRAQTFVRFGRDPSHIPESD